MSKAYQIKDGEKVFGIYRQYGLTYFGNILIALFLILIPFFFLTPLFTYGKIGVIIFASLVVLAVWYGLVKFVRWHGNKTIITDMRVIDIDQRKLFDRRISEITFSNIVDVSYRISGLFPTLFKYGTVTIKAGRGIITVELRKIKKLQEVVDLINELRETDRAIEDEDDTIKRTY